LPNAKDRGWTVKVKLLKFIIIFVSGLALAIAAVWFSPERGKVIMTVDNLAWGKDAAAAIINPALPKNAAEKKILSVLEDIKNGPWMANVAPLHGRLLRILTEAVKAKNVVEIGTSNGYSALWICLGLQATGGKLITHEIHPETASLAKANFRRAGVEQMVTVVLGDAHETVTRLQGPIDLLFIDADKPGYPDYLHKLLPLVRPGGLILADNMNQPEPSPDFIKAITTNPNLETIFLNMQATGISLTLKKP
jgi:caffeoyl-CoA O-methyltransferase